MNGNVLQAAAERIVAAWLQLQGRKDVSRTNGRQSLGGRHVDITYSGASGLRRAKVKPDAYFGVDPAKINDRSLVFYREDVRSYAFEALANVATRESGWMLDSDSDELLYYFHAIAQSEEEVTALMREGDEVFFSELAVDRDELVVLPMLQTRQWFESNMDRYTPRPVALAGAPAWYRLVPRDDIERAVTGINKVGPVFSSLSY